MAERRVVIENRKTGESYSVTPAGFRSHYEPNGFRILHWEGGEDYKEPKPATRKRSRRRRATATATAPTPAPEPAEEPQPGPE